MKTRLIAIALCFSLLMLLLVGCNDDDNGGDDLSQDCTHSYSNGVCIHCGESDPNYNSGSEGGSNEGSGNGSGEGSGSGSGGTSNGDSEGDGDKPADGEDDTQTPPIDFGGETDLPFVPAK